MKAPALNSAWRERIEPWWRLRSARERTLLSILGGIVLVLAMIFLVIRPLQNARAAARADIRTYDSLLLRLRTSVPAPSAMPRRSGDLATMVTASAAQFALPVRTRAQGADLHVEASGVAYETLVRWLANLHDTSDVRVARLSLTRAATLGEVDAAMVLRL